MSKKKLKKELRRLRRENRKLKKEVAELDDMLDSAFNTITGTTEKMRSMTGAVLAAKSGDFHPLNQLRNDMGIPFESAPYIEGLTPWPFNNGDEDDEQA